MFDYDGDVLAPRQRAAPIEVAAEPGDVLEDRATGFVGAVIRYEAGGVLLEDRRGRRRLLPLESGAFRVDGQIATVRPPSPEAETAAVTPSGSVARPSGPARIARASRIWVEGVHDAELLEHVWGDDLRELGIVVEPLHGADDLASAVRQFGPAPDRRLGILLDHLVPGSKESRIAATVEDPNVLIVGHPEVDVWACVRPGVVGLEAWPVIPRGVDWKTGVCDALGIAEPAVLWRRVLQRVTSYADLTRDLVGAVERMLDFLTDEG